MPSAVGAMRHLLRAIVTIGVMSGVVRAADLPTPRSGQTPPPASARTFLSIATDPAFGDLDAIRERGFLRVLVVPNKTHYLVDRGRQYGLAFEMVREFERTLNAQDGARRTKYLHAVFIPVRRDQIFARLEEGYGDIAVANLTVTEDRAALVDFSIPFLRDVREIVAASHTAPPLRSLDDLSGQRVYVRTSSSFFGHLQSLNQSFIDRGLPPMRIDAADETLEAEDLLELLNAGLISFTVVDEHIGRFWSKVFPSIVLHPSISIADGQSIAWAIRKQTPVLKALVDRFLAGHHARTTVGATLLQRYLKNVKWVKNATAQSERAQFERTIGFFRRYAEQYRFDPLMLAAQGYEESGLDQTKRSRAGAVGIMQLLPSTGQALKVGDILKEEANIHGGAKYMRTLADTYFADLDGDPYNRTLFAFAGYNAGPERIKALRSHARAAGLDPNIWFNNVETIAAMEIGRETVQYVANIAKYYIAYRLLADSEAGAR